MVTNNIYYKVVYSMYSDELKRIEDNLWHIGFHIDSFRKVIHEGVKESRFNFEESHKLLSLLNEYLLLEEIELDKLKNSVENLANEPNGIGNQARDL